jgi:hypothetical protein
VDRQFLFREAANKRVGQEFDLVMPLGFFTLPAFGLAGGTTGRRMGVLKGPEVMEGSE